MDLLKHTPYLLDDKTGQHLIDVALKLHEDVSLLRRDGTIDAATLDQLRREWRFRQIHESAAIEGNELTLNETRIAIQRGITISGKPSEHSDEVQRLNDALDYLEVLVRQTTPLTEHEIRLVHTLILGRGNRDAGVYRLVDVAITNSPHKPPIPLKVPEQMADLSGWLAREQDVPVALLAAVFHAWLVHIHPFRDGNGRTARAMTNLLLMRNGYPIVIIRKADRQRYYEALRASDDGDITLLLELLIERSEHSLQQIDRARTAVSGVSLTMEKIQQKEQEQKEFAYRAWADGVRLLGSTLEDIVSHAERISPDFVMKVAHYDVPTFEDYEQICSGRTGGNAWFIKLVIGRKNIRHSILLWIGYVSVDLKQLLGLPEFIPSLKVSIPNDTPPPTWKLADNSFPCSVREIAYVNGEYFRLNQVDHTYQLSQAENVVALTSELVTELLNGWFT